MIEVRFVFWEETVETWGADGAAYPLFSAQQKEQEIANEGIDPIIKSVINRIPKQNFVPSKRQA